MKYFSPKTLQEAIQYFTDEQVCIQTFARIRWADGKPECPACGHREHYYLAKQRRFKCKECWKQFTVKVGTLLEDSPIPLSKWLPALWMIVNDKNGISSYELGKALGITQKSAWFVLHRLRTALQCHSFEKIGGNGGEVEVDETFVGGKIANMHKSKKERMARVRGQQLKGDHLNKTIVMGLLDRDLRQVRAKVVPNVKRETLQNEVLREVEQGSKVYTDEWIGYKSLHEQFVHDVVNHVESYVNGQVHTNGIENFWSLLKRTLKGTYVAVEPFHLGKYVNEQVFRYNYRGGKRKENRITDAQRFELALSQVAGKRLTYDELTGKTGETTPF
ncbi:MAG: IS1595 family transposase [Candidatus Korobacteraceae bacterium]|jgi:transposase-like protein